MRRWTGFLTRAEWSRLAGFGGAVALLHLLGWGLFLYYSRSNPALAGLGTLAYTFGLRHAFDADHIAAIDNTTRKFLAGRQALARRRVLLLARPLDDRLLARRRPGGRREDGQLARSRCFQDYGGYIGAGVSGTFLWIIGILNLLVLLDIVRIFRDMKRGRVRQGELEERLLDRGFMNRFFVGRLRDQDQVELAHVPARASCSGSASTPPARSACSRSPPASPRTTCRSWP